MEVTDETGLLMYFASEQGRIILHDEKWQAEAVDTTKVHKYGNNIYGVEFLENPLRLTRPSQLDITSAFTVEVVVDERSSSVYSHHYVISEGSFAAPSIADNGKIGFALFLGKNSNYDKTWTVKDIEPPSGIDMFRGLHHYALTYDIDNGAHLYVDGVLAAKKWPPDGARYVYSPPGTQTIIVGSSNNQNRPTIYSVRISSIAKSAEDIKRTACKSFVCHSMKVIPITFQGPSQILLRKFSRYE